MTQAIKTINKPVLISFSGLPGVGKTTIAKQLARQTAFTYLRADTVEKPIIKHFATADIGPLGYQIIGDMALENLQTNGTAIIDCVNPIPLTRTLFKDITHRADAYFIGVEIICSDLDQHRARIEARHDAALDWQAVCHRNYEPWHEANLHLDTASIEPQTHARTIIKFLQNIEGRHL